MSYMQFAFTRATNIINITIIDIYINYRGFLVLVRRQCECTCNTFRSVINMSGYNFRVLKNNIFCVYAIMVSNCLYNH